MKLVEPGNLHLTLKFLGEVTEEKADEVIDCLGKLKGQGKFTVQLKGLGVFPTCKYMKVVWMGVTEGQEEIKKLQGEIDELLVSKGYKKDSRFHPHFTIARVRKINQENKKILQDLLKEQEETNWAKFSVEGIELMKSQLTSQGPIYSLLKKIGA